MHAGNKHDTARTNTNLCGIQTKHFNFDTAKKNPQKTKKKPEEKKPGLINVTWEGGVGRSQSKAFDD